VIWRQILQRCMLTEWEVEAAACVVVLIAGGGLRQLQCPPTFGGKAT
jgi:hypothetical protein